MNKAVITGATGAVGMALIEELLNQNTQVLVLCHPGSKRNSQFPEGIRKIECDASDYDSLELDEEYDAFYHLAWMGTTGTDRNNMELQQQNVVNSLKAVNLAKRLGCKTFVGIGSQAEYGRVEGELKADTETNPETGYGIKKLKANMETRKLARSLGMKHIWVRILSIYGPYDTPNSLVSYAIRSFKNNEKPSFTKGEQMWDYLFSKDAAKALSLLPDKGKDGKIYVLGSGKAKPLKEYILDIKEAVNPEAECDFNREYPANQVMYLKADTSDLKEDLNWEATTDFKEGIKKILEG